MPDGQTIALHEGRNPLHSNTRSAAGAPGELVRAVNYYV